MRAPTLSSVQRLLNSAIGILAEREPEAPPSLEVYEHPRRTRRSGR
jgi:hypothetical protein